MQTNETLTFLRKATKKENGRTGVIYRHTWATGFQDLIFDDNDAAARFKRSFGVPHEPVKV